MLIYKMNFCLLTLFSLLHYILSGRGLKVRAGCRQTEVQTDKRPLEATPKNWRTNRQTDRQTDKNCQEAGNTNSGAYYIPVLTPDAASRPAASLPLCPHNYWRGLVIYV